MIRAARYLLMTVLAAAVIITGWLWFDASRLYLRPSNQPIYVDIARGTRTRDIARQLEESGAIRSRWTFLAIHALRAGRTLKAGEYSFDQPASVFHILDKIIRGDVSYQVLTVPEGSNRFDIATAVASLGFSTRDEFLRATEDPAPIASLDPQATTVEGYLYPDTYQFPRHARPANIVRTMVDRFRQVYATLHPAAEPRPAHEAVIVASLVEKETAVALERPVIAGVFYNRLQKGMPLQCDPSIIYAGLLNGSYQGKIGESLLSMPSPYNTYLHAGLPPGPIANPGKASLLAALRPASTEYFYFVASGTGGHTFSRTLAEHNLAVSTYRKELSALEDSINSAPRNSASR